MQGLIEPDLAHPTLAVFNSLNWKRSGLVEIYIDHQILPQGKPFTIIDNDGRQAPAQPLGHRSDGTYWGIWVDEVPPMGYKSYRIIVDRTSDLKQVPRNAVPVTEVKNRWYQAVIDPENGTIRSLKDLEMNIELIDPMAPWAFGQLVHEQLGNRSQMESRTLISYTRNAPDTIWFESFEEGPIWNTLRFKGESEAAVGPAGLVIEMRFFNTAKRIDLVYSIRKGLNDDPESIYIAFPFRLDEGKIYCEVQGGVMEAGVDQIPGSTNDWNTHQNFAAVRSTSGQVLLTSHKVPLMQFGGINTGRYQYGAKPATTHVYGWPMNNYWTTNFNADYRGELTFAYTLSSTADPGNLAATRFGWGVRVPIPARVIPPGKPSGRAATASLLQIEPDNLLLINARPMETDRAIILQLREVGGKVVKREDLRIKIKEGAEEDNKTKDFKMRIEEVDVNGEAVWKAGNPVMFKPLESKFIKVLFTN
jgi:hypothetical protein